MIFQLYFGYHYRVYLSGVIKSQIIPLIILNLGIGFVASGINNFAHIGGLIGGVLTSMAVGVKYKSNKSDIINGIIILHIERIDLNGKKTAKLFYRVFHTRVIMDFENHTLPPI